MPTQKGVRGINTEKRVSRQLTITDEMPTYEEFRISGEDANLFIEVEAKPLTTPQVSVGREMHSKKSRGYIVHIDKEYVSVEHRASFQPRTIVLLSTAYLGYCLLPPVRRVLLDFYRSHDPVVAGFALFMLFIPLMSGAGLLFFASGEIMRCDQQELHFAKRRTWGRWHRFRFATKEIRQLRRTSRGAGTRSRYYTVLTFRHAGRTYDMLENLDPGPSDRILKACGAMGLDVLIASDNSAAMNRDIAERGWLVNPLKPDEHVAGRKDS